MAQNRLIQEMFAQAAMLVFTIAAVLYGLKWGLAGVSWGILASQVFGTCIYYILVYRTIPTRVLDLLRALAPGLLLNSMLVLVLVVVHAMISALKTSNPAIYLLIMMTAGLTAYIALFFFVPIPSLKTEVSRWREKINGGLAFVYK
jgi:hypothetical protein